MKNILVCDDDKEIANAIKKLLVYENYNVLVAYNGIEAIEIMKNNKVNLIILDIMMPRLDGLSSMIKIRENSNIPIILLSAKSEDSDKILGLRMGADDYITKPFNPDELIARVNSQIRRYTKFGGMYENSNHDGSIIVNGRISIDISQKQVFADGKPVKLTPTEYNIVEFFMKNQSIVFSAEKIYQEVWNEMSFSTENTVMVHIRRIREKIEINPSEPDYIKVVWGIGYKMEKYS